MSPDDELKGLTNALYDAALPSTTRVPGMGGSTALERIYAVMVAEYLEWTEGDLLDLLHGRLPDSVPARIGMGFAASVQANTGNRYGVVVIISVLKSFSDSKVTIKEGQLLQLLEEHAKAVGKRVEH